MSNDSYRTEERQVSGTDLVSTLKNIIREGNVRRIVIRNASGRTILDFPLTAGIVGAALLPFWAAVAGLAGFVAQYTLVIERSDDPPVRTPARH